MERIETKVNEIINELESLTNLPVYRDLKTMDGIKEFIVLKYAFYESAWSNDEVEAYIVDISILISQKKLQDLTESIRNVYNDTPFELIATGINVDHFNYEAIMYCCVEVVEK